MPFHWKTRKRRAPFLSTFQSQPSVLSADSPRPMSSGVVRACFAVSGGGGISGARCAAHDRPAGRLHRLLQLVAAVIDPRPFAFLALPHRGEIAVDRAAL